MSTLSVRAQANAFMDLLGRLYRYRQLTWEMTKREITDRYAGQVFGAIWALIHPLILMGIYVFMFAYVMGAKIQGRADVPGDYTAYLLAGLVPWLAFQESITKGVTAISLNTSLVKQVVFPVEVLPVKSVLASMVSQLIATSLLLLYLVSVHHTLPWTISLLPLLGMAQVLAMCGVSFLLAGVGAYFRDLKDITQVACLVNMYLMPIFFLPEWLPEGVRPLLYLNPFSYFVWCYQDACYAGSIEHPWAWPVFLLGSVLVFHVGYRVFNHLRTHFGSVL